MAFVPDTRVHGKRSRLWRPSVIERQTRPSLHLSQMTSFESLLQHSPHQNYKGKSFYEGVRRVEEIKSNPSIETIEKGIVAQVNILKGLKETQIRDESARRVEEKARWETEWAAWRKLEKDTCTILVQAQDSVPQTDRDRKKEQANEKFEIHAPKASPTWIPSRYNGGALEHHQRRLVEIFNSKKANILEISSQGRQPLPPALARALNARTIPGRSLAPSSQGRQPVPLVLAETLNARAATGRPFAISSQATTNITSSEVTIAKERFRAQLEAQVVKKGMPAESTQNPAKTTAADIEALARTLSAHTPTGRLPLLVCQPSPKSIPGNVEALERALDSRALAGPLLSQGPRPSPKIPLQEAYSLEPIIRKFRMRLSSKKAANNHTNSYFQSSGSASFVGFVGNSSDALDKLFEKYRGWFHEQVRRPDGANILQSTYRRERLDGR